MKVEWVHPSHIEDPDKGVVSTKAIPVVRVEALEEVVRRWRAQKNQNESVAFRMVMRELEDCVIQHNRLTTLPKEA